MRHPSHAPLPISPFAGDDWTVEESDYDPARAAWAESVFALGNGFLGVRGGFEEAVGTPGGGAVYLNGVHETVPITYHEKGHGFAEASDVRPPAANALGIEIEIAGEPFSLEAGELLSYSRRLDLRRGLLVRRIRWRSPAGRVSELRFERLVSLVHHGLAAQRITVMPDGFSAPVRLRSHLAAPPHGRGDDGDAEDFDPRLGPALGENPWRLETVVRDAELAGFVHRTRRRGIAVAALVTHRLPDGADLPPPVERDGDLLWETTLEASAAAPAVLEKFAAYGADESAGHDALVARVRAELDAAAAGFAALAAAQAAWLEDFWDDAAIGIAGNVEDARALRFAIFQVLQAAGRDGRTSVCAKGQTGEGYEGHYFWDAEIYVLPMLLHTRPEIARAMLLYRHRTLDKARENARLLGHRRGALYPWRTIGGGECSAYFPAGAAQYHINADIAFALRRYLEATGDDAFLLAHGAEMLFETARIWLAVGHHDPLRDGAFVINGVTGPDEYSALVDNNLYTNLMAQAHLRFAVATWERLGREWPERRQALADMLGLDAAEIAAWRRAADAMFVPHDAARGIHPQDDRFLHLAPWDFDATPPEHYPLLLHYHPLVLYRHQLCKQADLVLALFLCEEAFDAATRARDFAYYEPITVHDSTLSAPVFSIVASRLGEAAKAHDYFRRAAFVDLCDLHGNSAHGLHLAALGGTWMALAFGFAGMRPEGEELAFSPLLPAAWEGFSLRLGYRGRRLALRVGTNESEYRLLEGAPLRIRHHGRAFELRPGETVRVATAATAPEPAP